MRIWPAADRLSEPWKNGAGTMAIIHTSPEEAGWDTLNWRISTAVITRPAPFSHFPGLDRVFTPYHGGTVTLHLPDGAHRITPGDAPFAFSGEAECYCDHETPETLVLNLQTRAPYRAVVAHDATVWDGPAEARYLFALEPVAALGLATGDLAELTSSERPATEKALFVAIRRA